MNKARIFKTGKIITAQDVFDGKYDTHENFVDVEEDFRVVYVCRAKNNGRPYFRFYYSLEDYRIMFPDKADRYEIIFNQRHYQETQWHKEWENRFRPFAKIEEYIFNSDVSKWKRADVFYQKTNTCIEFQHSFIDYDFEERNKFYKELGINTIWLYDLTHLDIKPARNDAYVILEDNAKGFFRIADNQENLENNIVFVQAKDNLIYQVRFLYRKEINNKLKSTVRYFYPLSIDTVSDFLVKIKDDEYRIQREKIKQVSAKFLEELKANMEYTNLFSIWKTSYSWMIVSCKGYSKQLLICENKNRIGEMETGGFSIPPAIVSRNIEIINNRLTWENNRKLIYHSDAEKPIWKLEYSQEKAMK